MPMGPGALSSISATSPDKACADGLTALDGEFIDLAFTQASKPVVISSTDAGDADSFRYLLMPRRLLS